jgi:hypothetical protein
LQAITATISIGLSTEKIEIESSKYKDIMMIKNRTKFALTVGIGLSLFSGLSHTAFEKEDDTALVIPHPSAPARLEILALIHDDEGFSVLSKSEIRRIPNHLVARDLRRILQSEVKARLDNHINFRVQQGSDGEFSLQECGGLDGGGDILDRMWKALFNHDAMGIKAVKAVDELIDKHSPEIISVTKSAIDLGDRALVVGDRALVLTGVGMALWTIPKIYYFFWPTAEMNNKDFAQRVLQAYNICLSEHLTPEDGVKGIPSACTGSPYSIESIDSIEYGDRCYENARSNTIR